LIETAVELLVRRPFSSQSCVLSQSLPGHITPLCQHLQPHSRELRKPLVESYQQGRRAELANEHLVLDVNTVYLLWCGSKKNLQPLTDTGHYGGDLTGRNDDLLLYELGRIHHL